jgi:Protein of unknown function, DUF488
MRGRGGTGSRYNPQFNQAALAALLSDAGIAYRHASSSADVSRVSQARSALAAFVFAAFRSYAARMGTERWQEELAAALAQLEPSTAHHQGLSLGHPRLFSAAFPRSP